MTTTAVKRKPLPKGPAGALRAVRGHLAGAGFGEGRGGLVITARSDRLSVGVMRTQFPDDREMRRLITTLEDFTRVRLVDVEVNAGAMFDSYTFTRVTPDGN